MALKFLEKLGEVAKSFSVQEQDTALIRHHSKNIIGFYSPAENSGTTNLVCNIAEYLQGPTSPTVLVDFNFESPGCYRYWIEEIPRDRSLINYFKNPTMRPNEVISGGNAGFGIISMYGDEDPSEYCDIRLDSINKLLMDLATQYKYVLVDLGTSINDEQTIQGLLTCNKVYSVVRPVGTQLEKLMFIQGKIENLCHYPKIKDVIQTMILGTQIGPKEMEEYGFNLIGNVALDNDIMISADNSKIISATGKSKAVARYTELIKSIGEDIKQLVANTTLVSEADISDVSLTTDTDDSDVLDDDLLDE